MILPCGSKSKSKEELTGIQVNPKMSCMSSFSSEVKEEVRSTMDVETWSIATLNKDKTKHVIEDEENFNAARLVTSDDFDEDRQVEAIMGQFI